MKKNGVKTEVIICLWDAAITIELQWEKDTAKNYIKKSSQDYACK